MCNSQVITYFECLNAVKLIIHKKQICEAFNFISFTIQSYNYIDIVVKGHDMNVGNTGLALGHKNL